MILLTFIFVIIAVNILRAMFVASLLLGGFIFLSKTVSKELMIIAKILATFFGLIAFPFTYAYWSTPMTEFNSAYDLMQTPYLLAPLFGIGVAVGAIWAWAKNDRQGIIIANIFLLCILICMLLIYQHSA